MLLLPKTVLPISSPPIPNGAVRVEGERITAVGKASDLKPLPKEEVVELPNAVLSPGLINAHCHLDYTQLRGAIAPPESFVAWIKNLNAQKGHFSQTDYLDAVTKGFELLIQSGTTTVLNIESFPELLPLMQKPPIRTWWFFELVDIRNKLYDETSLAGALAFFEKNPGWPGGFGLSPHAPYTVSTDLFRLAKRVCDQTKMLMTTHVAESLSEQEMFSHATGELFEFMGSLGRDNTDCGHGSPFSHLRELGVLTENALLVHMNYLQDYDFKALENGKYSIVHCPKSCAYFNHRKFELDRLLSLGVNVCIGTDSLASNNTLDLRAEIRLAQKMHPGIPAHDWLEMVTVNPAKALGLEGKLGVIEPNAFADLVAFPANNDDPCDSILANTAPPEFMMVNGQVIGK